MLSYGTTAAASPSLPASAGAPVWVVRRLLRGSRRLFAPLWSRSGFRRMLFRCRLRVLLGPAAAVASGGVEAAAPAAPGPVERVATVPGALGQVAGARGAKPVRDVVVHETSVSAPLEPAAPSPQGWVGRDGGFVRSCGANCVDRPAFAVDAGSFLIDAGAGGTDIGWFCEFLQPVAPKGNRRRE